MPSKKYEFLEHTADLKFRSYGNTLEECFANAARAMFSSITDLGAVNGKEERLVSVKASTPEMLLHDFLSEALFLFDTKGFLSREFKVSIEKDGGYSLKATLTGEAFDPKRHSILEDIKAVTYHDLVVKKEKDGYAATVLCDI